MNRKPWLLLCLLLTLNPATAHDSDSDSDSEARYLANEGLMVTHGATKILFDPLFNESYGQYRLLPDAMRTALMNGDAPWDGVDAVFISHYHDDHFAPQDMFDYLHRNSTVLLFAPAQAVAALQDIAAGDDEVFDRVTAVYLDAGEAPQRFERAGLLIEVVRIPHSGWPDRRLDVENLAWRVTLDDGPTVLHLGDADTRDLHFASAANYWQQRQPDIAFPPYWYFLSTSGREVLTKRLQAAQAVGIHVPAAVPANADAREDGLRDVDLFTTPGETRGIRHSHAGAERVAQPTQSDPNQ